MPIRVLPEAAYRRLRELAEAEEMGVEELVLNMALRDASPSEAAEAFWEAAETLLAQAEEELGRGDLRQASEKIWGAAALAVKALALERDGRRLKRHRELWQYVADLSRRLGDGQLRRLWQVASSMHANFYEGWATAEYVRDALDDVREFVERLGRLRPRKS